MNRRHALLVPLLLAACVACQPSANEASAASEEAASQPPADAAGTPQAPIEVPDPEDDDVRSGVPNPVEIPPPDAPTPPMAEGADITYTCEDGSELRVTYAGGMANVTLADGQIVPLPRSAQAAKEAGGEMYVGEALGLHRLGNVVELQQGDGATRRCRESGGNA